MDKSGDVSRDTVSLTYEELATRLGIDVQSARRRVVRHRWARTRGNDGKARIAVPAEVLAPPATVSGHVAGTVLETDPATVPGTEPATRPATVTVTPEVMSLLLSQVAELGDAKEGRGRAEGEATALRGEVAALRSALDQERALRIAAGAAQERAQGELAKVMAGPPWRRALRVLLGPEG